MGTYYFSCIGFGSYHFYGEGGGGCLFVGGGAGPEFPSSLKGDIISKTAVYPRRHFWDPNGTFGQDPWESENCLLWYHSSNCDKGLKRLSGLNFLHMKLQSTFQWKEGIASEVYVPQFLWNALFFWLRPPVSHTNHRLDHFFLHLTHHTMSDMQGLWQMTTKIRFSPRLFIYFDLRANWIGCSLTLLMLTNKVWGNLTLKYDLAARSMKRLQHKITLWVPKGTHLPSFLLEIITLEI